jgi:hypothetical protein
LPARSTTSTCDTGLRETAAPTTTTSAPRFAITRSLGHRMLLSFS